MADGAQGDDEEILGDPLPPDDRLWRHPSEIAWLDDSSRHRAPWGTALVSAAGGAFAVGALWLAIGGGDDGGQLATQWVSLVPVESVAPLVIPADDWSEEITRSARPGTASVTALDESVTIAGAVAVRDDGFYLTSGRAIGDHHTVVLVTSAGVSSDAKVVGYDPLTDLSVLHTDGSTVPAVIAATPDIGTGDSVALVDPRGEATEHVVVDEATVSATVDGDWLVGVVALDGVLGETPPGSPAVDDTGAVVGVTVATASDVPAVLVPIDVATDVASELIESGVADHPWIGTTLSDADPAATGAAAGALVTAVEADGPAARGGMLEGDVVVGLDGIGVDSMAEMVAALRTRRPGEVVEVTVLRGDEHVDCQVELASACTGDCG